MKDDIFEGREIPEAEQEKVKDRILDMDDKKMQYYEKLRQKAKHWAREKTGKTGSALSEYLFLLPDFFVLVTRLALDKRVPTKRKLMMGGIIAYMMMPIDIIPDFIPILGHVDDMVLLVMELNMVLNDTDQKVLEDNWSGEGNILQIMQKITANAEKFLDKNVLQRIKKWLGKRS